MSKVMKNMAVVVATTMGQIWEMVSTTEETSIVVTTNQGDFRVSCKTGSDEVKVEPWIW